MPEPMPSPCRVCGGELGERLPVGIGRSAWHCDRCGWRLGDAPDADLRPPRVEVVYYLRYAARVKIGTSSTPRSRLAAIRHDELLAFEPGGRTLEQQRHREFASLREGGEWFTSAAPLTDHIAALQAVQRDPWAAYDRWLGDAFRRLSS
ncbi:GIY-YIG nuclease family protein [Microbacterium sp. 179-B 1A2 NHS]|uniref:GIY-YIG nuclease family protein n=1 Tax=Microbacterium sp. 179-B 1A2 NHS TaxID=3142383 RepID=UPI0039A31E0E